MGHALDKILAGKKIAAAEKKNVVRQVPNQRYKQEGGNSIQEI